MVLPWLRRLVTAEVRILARISRCGIRVALGQVFSDFFGSLSVSLHRVSTLIYLGDELQMCCWPQFRDIFSPHRHEQQQQLQDLTFPIDADFNVCRYIFVCPSFVLVLCVLMKRFLWTGASNLFVNESFFQLQSSFPPF
jgi:hypothetical protein